MDRTFRKSCNVAVLQVDRMKQEVRREQRPINLLGRYPFRRGTIKVTDAVPAFVLLSDDVFNP
jgi:hypothetical protein